MHSQSRFASCLSMLLTLSLLACFILPVATQAQDSDVTGSFFGRVTGPNQAPPIGGAKVTIRNTETGTQRIKITDANGEFKQSALLSGTYTITVEAANYAPSTTTHRLFVTKSNRVVPVPIELTPLNQNTATNTQPNTTPSPSASPSASPGNQANVTPSPSASPANGTAQNGQQSSGGQGTANTQEDTSVGPFSSSDARRGGAFSDKEVSTLPLGARTLTRSFDELALLIPGVALPPLTIGNGSGPGVGAGLGSAGQFSVNGLRSRANNFTVDGSDNNDEDIGVRRQGFFSLVPQPIESIQEYQVTTLLAPAQYGRNIGAQVNAVSKSGGNQFHGTIFGFINSSQLNARDAFDTTNGNGTSTVRSQITGQAAFVCPNFAGCPGNATPLTATNQSGGEDSLTLGQGGFVLGGPIKKDKAFFFVSYERQALNATKEESFAVPTLDQRGVFNSGATGFFADCLTPDVGFNITNCTPANRTHFFPVQGYPTSLVGDGVFSLFPFPNNPTGVYGNNTYTEVLPASARGNVASGKYDQNFDLWGRPQTFTARYNFTQDWRDIPVTGGALFSTLRPRVRTQNFSTFLTSELSNSMSNVLRLSYGRTRLITDPVRDPFLIPSQIHPSDPFLLNARRLVNLTLANAAGVPNTGPSLYAVASTTECGIAGGAGGNCAFGGGLGPVGQINISGFSPVGVDVNFFPQRRVNNTYQIADTIGYRAGHHSLAFGLDTRRVELNSDLPRNSRPLLTFIGAPEFDFNPNSPNLFTGNFISGATLAAAGAPSGAFLSIARTSSTGTGIGLRYYELNGFFQDEWRIRPNLSINFGLRYEYNTPPGENHRLIENTFNDPLLSNPNVIDLRRFLAGRSQIFDPDHNNFGPRVGIAYSPNWFGREHSTVVRAGYGVFYDQVLGALVSQSRNVFPNFITINTGGFGGGLTGNGDFQFFNPALGGIIFPNLGFIPLVQPGTVNTLNPNLPGLGVVLNVFASGNEFPNPIAITLPDRNLVTPSAEHFSVTFEQQLSSDMLLSVGYVGTRGHNLLRASTPNLGPNNIVLPFLADTNLSGEPVISGFLTAPGAFSRNSSTFDRPFPNAGPVSIYESGGGSRYDALQLQLRGRFRRGLQYQANYTFAKARDNASDLFDLAGAPALPQDSLTRAGEFGPSNFDVRHRFAYNLIYDFPSNGNDSGFYRAVFGGLQFASTGFFQTGQPFTINSINDINLDGNLTDRLNTTQGLVITGNRRQPVSITPGTRVATLLAPIGSDGALGRNTFRAGNVLNLDLAVVKNFSLNETQRIIFRMDVFNFINRANYGIPVRFLEAPGFGQATDTVTPGRRIQFALKYSF